jgi:GNAT superfamily N-acetyltransferase
VDAPDTVTVAPASPTSPEGRFALHAYIEDIVSRYHGRPATPDEVRDVLADEPSDDLVPPRGVFLVATRTGAVVGCAGLRMVGDPDGHDQVGSDRVGGDRLGNDRIGELTRVYVLPSARGQGLGGRLIGVLEEWARDRGVGTLRLDTRSDLVEARGLYAKHGYREVEAFSAEPYAEHWFVKDLASTGRADPCEENVADLAVGADRPRPTG